MMDSGPEDPSTWAMMEVMDPQIVKIIAIILIVCLIGMVFIGFL